MKKIIYKKIDDCGNELRVLCDADKAPHVLEVRLFIRSDRKERTLGIIDKIERVVNMVRTRSKHLHSKSNSYGFNYLLINEAKTFDVVVLKDEITTYKIPKHIILKHGEFLFFKQRGFEKQIFVPLALLDTFCIQEKMF